jgi:two-component system cell cycle response regulator DivK
MTSPKPVLVIDDNASNVVLLEYLLTANGYEVRCATDAESALALIAQHKPRLILTDIQLPGASGLELTQRLKSNPSTADIRIIAISAFAMPADEQRALDAGCDGYIAKPIDTRTFPDFVAEHIDQE